jgi:hypothetical protein
MSENKMGPNESLVGHLILQYTIYKSKLFVYQGREIIH